MSATKRLPPGQRAVDGFPRFGTHLHRPPPPVPADPTIQIAGAVTEAFHVPVADLAHLPRIELVSDFHCVSGWSATDLQWEGVAFAAFYSGLIEPRLKRGGSITHLVFEGLDRYRSIVELGDALGEQVVIADRLNGSPLAPDHGAPVRLVSPLQYGFVSTKHLCRVDVRSGDPADNYHPSPIIQLGLRGLLTPHPRARVWEEERHRYLPAWMVRPIYRAIIAPMTKLCARGSRAQEP